MQSAEIGFSPDFDRTVRGAERGGLWSVVVAEDVVDYDSGVVRLVGVGVGRTVMFGALWVSEIQK